MKTKLVICADKIEMHQGIYLISEYYKQRPEKDGHKIFLVDRGPFYQLSNVKPEVTPPEERELIFCEEEIAAELAPRKQIDSQMSISRISRGQNSENVCENLIDWLLCKDIS